MRSFSRRRAQTLGSVSIQQTFTQRWITVELVSNPDLNNKERGPGPSSRPERLMSNIYSLDLKVRKGGLPPLFSRNLLSALLQQLRHQTSPSRLMICSQACSV